MTETPALVLPDPNVRPTLPVWPDTGTLLGLSRAATYDAIARGEIPHLKIGRRVLVPVAALRRLLESMTHERARVRSIECRVARA